MNENKELQVNENLISNLVLRGDLNGLKPAEKVQYYGAICERLGLDPLTQPFKILNLSGKEVLYCDRSGAQQLNKLHSVSHQITARETVQDCYIVTARAYLPSGRQTESIGAVPISNLKGVNLCNALMKAETKAKRRSTLDLLGLGILDESEIETIPNARPMPAPVKPVVLTPKTRKAILKVVESHVFSVEEKQKANSFCNSNPLEVKGLRFLESLRNHEKVRKQAEKETPSETATTAEITAVCVDCNATTNHEFPTSDDNGNWRCYSGGAWLCPTCQKPPETPDLPEPEGTPKELRERAKSLRESAHRSDDPNMYRSEMAKAERLSKIADKREAEQEREAIQGEDNETPMTEKQSADLLKVFHFYGFTPELMQVFGEFVQNSIGLDIESSAFASELIANFKIYLDSWERKNELPEN